MTYRAYDILSAILMALFIASLPLMRFVSLWWLALTIPSGALIPWWLTLPLSPTDRWIRS